MKASGIAAEIWRRTKKAAIDAHDWARVNLWYLLAGFGILLTAIVAASIYQIYAVYTQCAVYMDIQLANQVAPRQTGVYAIPRQIRVGQMISKDELRKRLLRVGYQETSQDAGAADEYFPGSFILRPDQIEVWTNDDALMDELPEMIRIDFYPNSADKEQISAIIDTMTGSKLQAVWLPAELIESGFNYDIHSSRYPDFDQFPPALVKALIAIEDRNFFRHPGLDLRGICRAFIRNQWRGKTREGGSTITQQFIKTQFLTSKRTWERKFVEAMMALAIERRMNKKQIFTFYANSVYLGQNGKTAVHGFNHASHSFFDKELSELSTGEAALLAGLVKAPNRYSPSRHPEEATARRNLVLQAMVETGGLSAAEAAVAKAEKLALSKLTLLENSGLDPEIAESAKP